MKNRTAGRLAWSLALVSSSLAVAGLVFGLLSHESFVSFNGPFAVVGVFPFALLGAILASRRPSNPIGWLFCSIAVDFAFNILAQSVARYGLQTNPGSIPGGAIASWFALWSWIPAVILLLIFSLRLRAIPLLSENRTGESKRGPFRASLTRCGPR